MEEAYTCYAKEGDVPTLAAVRNNELLQATPLSPLHEPTTGYFIGGNTGTYSSQIKTNAIMTKIEGWVGNHGIRALRLTFSDGTNQDLGIQKGVPEYQSIDLVGKIVTRCALHGNGVGKRFGKLGLWFDGEEEEHVIAQPGNKAQVYLPLVGCGLVLGYMSNHGDEIDAFGLVFARPLRDIVAKSTWKKPRNQGPPKMEVIDGLDYLNNSLSEVTFHREKKVTTTTSTKRESDWTVSTKLDFRLETSWEEGVPGVERAQIKASFGFDLGTSTTGILVQEETKVVEETWTWNPVVKPGEHFNQNMYQVECTITIPYKADVIFTTDKGAVFTLKQTGEYNLLNATRRAIYPPDYLGDLATVVAEKRSTPEAWSET